MEFSIKDIINLLLKRIIIISACTLAGLFIFFIYNKVIVKPSYTAYVQMYVNPDYSTSSANLTELDYAQKVVNTYINFLQTKTFYKQVAERSNLKYTEYEIKEMTTIKSVNNTEIFQISVTTHTPEDSFKLVQEMQNIVPELIQGIKHSADISVVDPVTLPASPSGPNILFNTLIGGIAGLLLSVFGCLLWEILDVTVKNQEDLAKRYQIPILGAIPNFRRNGKNIRFIHRILKSGNRKQKLSDGNTTKEVEDGIEKGIEDNRKFLITEAYKALRTNLRFTLRSDGCKKIIISSPIPEDGKSTTSTNIAITIAQTGAKVLLIDCDLRKGRLHNFFNLKSSPGVSDCLSSIYDFYTMIQSTSQSNLKLLAMGTIPPNPTELLASVQMEELLRNLEREFDYIIIDTPPVNIVSDSLSLVKMVDGVILVVREGVTTHPNISSAMTKYDFAKANILGFVINSVSLNQGKRYQPNYNYYYYKKKND